MMRQVTVRVPATTANLGPGFDCFGMALSPFNSVTLTASDRFSVEVAGEGASELSRGHDNLAARTLVRYFAAVESAVPPLRILIDNAIPLARGLGSSAAAIVGTLVAANAFAGQPLGEEALLQLAAQIEGHADNVAAALMGGLTICVTAASPTILALTCGGEPAIAHCLDQRAIELGVAGRAEIREISPTGAVVVDQEGCE